MHLLPLIPFPYDLQLALPEALATDVESLRGTGYFSDLEPRGIPALAELSRALSSTGGESYADAVASAMKLAISRSAAMQTAIFPVVRRELIDGLTELFGLNNAYQQGLKARYDRAGPRLGSPGGYEQLRHAETRGTRRIVAAAKSIVTELCRLAEETEFVYARVLFPSASPPGVNLPSPDTSGDRKSKAQLQRHAWIANDILTDAETFDKQWLTNINSRSPVTLVRAVRNLSFQISAELRLLTDIGIDSLPVPGVLTHHAHGYYTFGGPPRTASADAVASLIVRYAYAEGGYGYPHFGEGVLEFFGLGQTRYQTRQQCRDTAAWYFGYEHDSELLNGFDNRLIKMLTYRMVRSLVRFPGAVRFVEGLGGGP